MFILGHKLELFLVYRYMNDGIGDHFYTTNWSELGAGGHDYTLEGIQCYVYP
jgi:Repeat of unknown function (DUF5648)